MNLYDKASLIITPNAYKAGKIYALKPTSGAGDLTFARAGVKRVRNAAGNWVEIGANVPPLHYPVGGGCPSWLIESQVTNTLTWSQLFAQYHTNRCVAVDLGTPSIFSSGSLARFTANAADARFGKILGILTSGLTYTVSAFFDVSEGNFAGVSDASGNFRIFNLTTGAVVGSGGGTLSITCRSTSENGNIRRVSFSFTATTSTNHFLNIGTSGGTLSTTNEKVAAGYFMLEPGLVTTSYIETGASTVTRLADVPSLTGASALIGQTEGTLAAEIDLTATNNSIRWILALTDGTNNNTLSLLVNNPSGTSNRLSCFVNSGGATQALIDAPALPTLGRHKLVMSYIANNVRLWVDGVFIGSDLSATIPATSVINLGQRSGGQFDSLINLAAIYPTRLSDAECLALSTL